MTSGVACHHRLWAAHTVERRRAWHDNTALGQHARSDDIGRGMPSSPLDSIHDWKMSVMSCYPCPWKAHTIALRLVLQCYNHPWAAHTIGRRRALNVIIALGQYTWQNYVSCDKLSSPLKSIHDGTMSGGTGYHRPWKSQTIIRCQAWHANIAFG